MAYSHADLEQILRNLGHDPTCGACMGVALTGYGLPGENHTCRAPSVSYTDCNQPTERCGGCDVCQAGQDGPYESRVYGRDALARALSQRSEGDAWDELLEDDLSEDFREAWRKEADYIMAILDSLRVS